MGLLARLARLRAGLAPLVAGLLAGAGAQAQPNALEAAIKASYLYKLAPFVAWPPQVFPAPDSPLVICVIGDDPFGSLLDRAVTGQHVGTRSIVVNRLPVADREAPCQIAFLGGSRAQPVKDALRALRGAPILTVTDDPAAPGVVDFVVVQDRVRFRIDDEAAAENGLTISSKLLSLALTVTPRKPSGSGQ